MREKTNAAPRPFATPCLMLKTAIGSMESSVIEPPQGSLYTLIKLSTVASATITAPSTNVSVFEFFILYHSFLRTKKCVCLIKGHTHRYTHYFPTLALPISGAVRTSICSFSAEKHSAPVLFYVLLLLYCFFRGFSIAFLIFPT